MVVATVFTVDAPALEQDSAIALAGVSPAEVVADAVVAFDDGAVSFLREDQRKDDRALALGIGRFFARTVLGGAVVEAVEQALIDRAGGDRRRHRGAVGGFRERGVEDDLVAGELEEQGLVLQVPRINHVGDEVVADGSKLVLRIVGGTEVREADVVGVLRGLERRVADLRHRRIDDRRSRHAVVASAVRRGNCHPAAAGTGGAFDDDSREVVAHAFRQEVLLQECGEASFDAHDFVHLALNTRGVGKEILVECWSSHDVWRDERCVCLLNVGPIGPYDVSKASCLMSGEVARRLLRSKIIQRACEGNRRFLRFDGRKYIPSALMSNTKSRRPTSV